MPEGTVKKILLGLVGAAILVGVAIAHRAGSLDPLYRWVGLREPASAPAAGPHAGPEMPAGHDGHGASPSGLADRATIAVSPPMQQRIGLATSRVARDRLVMSIRTVGILEPDQTRLARLHARVSGWIQRVHVNFVGQDVAAGDPLVEIYSPELLSAQEEFLIALETARREGDSSPAVRLARSARRRLELWGVATRELEEIERTRTARETLVLRAPIGGRVLERNALEGAYVSPETELYRIADLSVLWLMARIYEYELVHVEVGQSVEITLPSQPGETLEGTISFVEPVLQETTRSVRVRVEVANPEGRHRPGMYADIELVHDMGEGLLVPESAVLRTGERAIAYRALPGDRFQPVEVGLGSRFGDRFEVRSGLAEGDLVVTSGNFLIDSDSRLKSVAGAPRHQH